jgi:hypothetical protein
VTLTPSIASGCARRCYTLQGIGGIFSTAMALMLLVMQMQKNQRIVGDAISAHFLAVQGQYLATACRPVNADSTAASI